MLYFARMLDKIRKMNTSELREDCQANLGKGFDHRCVRFLQVEYNDLVQQTLLGGTDEEILKWCFAVGRELSTDDIWIWNQFLKKVGWRDPASDILAQRKKESGLEHRDDIVTMLDYIEADEGRK